MLPAQRLTDELVAWGRPDSFAHELDPTIERWKITRLLAKRFRDWQTGAAPKQIITTQPQVSKTTICSIWGPAWLLDWDPRFRLMLLAYGAELSQDNARRVRDIFANYPHVLRTQLQPDAKRSDWWHTTEGGGIYATGVDGGIAGHPVDGIIIDDPHKNRREANSQHQRDVVGRWYTDDVLQRFRGVERIMLVQTRWHVDDLAGRIMKTEGVRRFRDDGTEILGEDGKPLGEWLLTHIPAIADPSIQDGPDPLGRKPGEVACPEAGYTAEGLAKRFRVVGRAAAMSTYQGSPIVAEGTMLKRDQFRVLREQGMRPIEWADLVVTSWDFASGKAVDTDDQGERGISKRKRKRSRCVGQLWMKDTHDGTPRYTLLDMVYGYWSQPEQVRQFYAFVKKHPAATRHLIEDASGGQGVIQRAHADGKAKGIEAIQPAGEGSKEDRADNVTPSLEAGEIWVPGWVGSDDEINDGATWVDEFLNECAGFPDAWPTDDMVDAFSQAHRWLSRRRSTPTGAIDAYQVDTGWDR